MYFSRYDLLPSASADVASETRTPIFTSFSRSSSLASSADPESPPELPPDAYFEPPPDPHATSENAITITNRALNSFFVILFILISSYLIRKRLYKGCLPLYMTITTSAESSPCARLPLQILPVKI